jgi:Uma2 family endonuclease
MSATLNITVPDSTVVHFEPSKLRMNDEEFFEFCQLNPELRIERSSEGDITVMAPTGGTTGRQNAKLIARLTNWAEEDGTGQVFDSSTVFILPNGAGRSPDASWIRNDRWTALTPRQQQQFPPLCPDFVVELRSATDSLKLLQEKMAEYIENGAQLGWLIDPLDRRVHIYSPGARPQTLENPAEVPGEPLLRSFRLDVTSIWD